MTKVGGWKTRWVPTCRLGAAVCIPCWRSPPPCLRGLWCRALARPTLGGHQRGLTWRTLRGGEGRPVSVPSQTILRPDLRWQRCCSRSRLRPALSRRPRPAWRPTGSPPGGAWQWGAPTVPPSPAAEIYWGHYVTSHISPWWHLTGDLQRDTRPPPSSVSPDHSFSYRFIKFILCSIFYTNLFSLFSQ